MTDRQQYILRKAKENISELRNKLDDIMYRTDLLPDNEYKKIREAYDLICKANDMLP